MRAAINKAANAATDIVLHKFAEITGYSLHLLFIHSFGLFLLHQLVDGFDFEPELSSDVKNLVKEAEDFLSTIERDEVRRAVLLLGAAGQEIYRTMMFLDEGEPFAIVCFSAANQHIGAAYEVLKCAASSTETAKTTLGRIGANARHAENRAMKQDVFKWLDENPPQKMDWAATVISQTRVPVAWRTARDWVGEWKKLRSTGTL